jgi:hypothetical protein
MYLKAMCLNIGLVNEEQSHFIADLIPAGVIRVVSAPHGVEVQRLNYTRITVHARGKTRRD